MLLIQFEFFKMECQLRLQMDYSLSRHHECLIFFILTIVRNLTNLLINCQDLKPEIAIQRLDLTQLPNFLK